MIVSSPHLVRPQLMAVSKLENEMGYQVATECYNQLLGNDIVKETNKLFIPGTAS